MNPKNFTILLALPLASAPDAQNASALLREGDSVGGAVVTSFPFSPTVNSVGGYAASMRVWDGAQYKSLIWGNPSGGTGATLIAQGQIGDLDQSLFGSTIGMDDSGNLLYTSNFVDLLTGNAGDSVWRNSTALALENDLVPGLAGVTYYDFSNTHLTPSGFGSWTAKYGTVWGPDEGVALVTDGGVILHKTGDLIPGLPGALGKKAVREHRYSSQGSHYIANVVVGQSSDYLVLDGVPLMTSAGLLGGLAPVPADAGGQPGELWGGFDEVAVNENGDYMARAVNVGGPFGTGYVLLLNGKIVHRNGDIVSGEQLVGPSQDVVMNEVGDIAFSWRIASTNSPAVFLNNSLLAKAGDPVDWDGDGVIEPTSVITHIWSDSLAMAADRRIYFTAQVDVAGAPNQYGFFFIDDPCSTSVQKFGVGCIGSNGLATSLAIDGCVASGSSPTISVSNVEPLGMVAILFGQGAGESQLGSSGCTLNLTGVLGSILMLSADAGGSASVTVPVTGLMPGASIAMQAFSTDASSPLGFVGSNGLKIVVD